MTSESEYRDAVVSAAQAGPEPTDELIAVVRSAGLVSPMGDTAEMEVAA